MSRSRRYRLLCSIARGLDHVGDRWTLLLLRDLHAGPARFTDLQSGLPGLASNLLTDRLRRLEDGGLLRRRSAEFGATVYELTDLRESTGPLLFDLAQLGSHFPPDDDPRRPGNLRTIAITLKEALRRVVDPATHLRAGLLVDDEAFEITVADGDVQVYYRTPSDVDVVVATTYEPLIAAGDGDLPLDQFVANHVRLIDGDPAKRDELLTLLGRAFGALEEDET